MERDSTTATAPGSGIGTKDGSGSGDSDQPYSGYRIYHFTTREMLRLLELRSDVLEARLGRGRFEMDLVGR